MQRFWPQRGLLIRTLTLLIVMCFNLTAILLFVAAYSYGQSPTITARRDSLPEENRSLQGSLPGINWPDLHKGLPNRYQAEKSDPMPIARPNNTFYHHPSDGPNVVRATLDNMPVMKPDTSTHYTMLRTTLPDEILKQTPSLKPPVFPKKR